ncbi:PDR/VanB family oxidoreductase [Pseudonocardia kongjuensis]|uniref:PDR/VanB family oxidoreductase n=1 Tax=Pseudonocardia kongjuensis TaxID=102227 RepID=A0ABN1Y5E4_9PSEU
MTAAEQIQELEVVRRVDEAEGVVSLQLAAPAGRTLPAWEPGAHIDVVLPDGSARQYSLHGTGAEWEISVLDVRDGRGGSRWIHANAQEGTALRVRGPRNHFALVQAERYIFIAGGIGITPIIAMVREAERRGADWRLVYGGRSRSSMAFAKELEELGDRVHLVPQDTEGLIDIAEALGAPQAGTAVYCCGPEPLLESVEAACQAWPAGTLHVERFSALPVDTSHDGSFEVVAQRTGISAVVPPDRSVLDVLADHGIDIPTSCGEGVCGTCETRVLEGEIEHRDALLSDAERAENTVMMVCCSRARSARLVLDI